MPSSANAQKSNKRSRNEKQQQTEKPSKKNRFPTPEEPEPEVVEEETKEDPPEEVLSKEEGEDAISELSMDEDMMDHEEYLNSIEVGEEGEPVYANSRMEQHPLQKGRSHQYGDFTGHRELKDNSIANEKANYQTFSLLQTPKEDMVTDRSKPVLISQPNIMLKSLDYKELYQFKDEWFMTNPEIRKCMDRSQHIPTELHPIIRDITNLEEKEWKALDDETFFNILLKWIPRSNEKNQLGQTAEERLRSLRLNFNGMSMNPVYNFLKQFYREFKSWDTEHAHLSKEEKENRTGKVIKKIIEGIKQRSNDNYITRELAVSLELHGTFDTPSSFGSFLLQKAKEAIITVAEALKYGMGFTNPSNNNSSDNRQKGGTKPSNTTKANQKHQGSNKDSISNNKGSGTGGGDIVCTGCGRKNHSVADCNLKSHPDFNHDTSTTWAESKTGRAWAAVKNKEGNPFLVCRVTEH